MKSFHLCLTGLLGAGLLLAASACQRPEEVPAPADLIPRDKLILLIADMQELESQVESSRLTPDSSRALFLEQQKALFWRHEVTDSTFQRSYRYYGIHGRDLHEIYGIVIDTLDLRAKKFAPHPDTPPHP